MFPRLLAVATLVLLAAPGCKTTGPPTINRIWGDSIVPANDSTDYQCDAWDWNLEPITYAWSCDRGRLGWDSVNLVRWYAPESSGPAVVRGWVTDRDNNVTIDSVVVKVTKVTGTVLSYAGAVRADGFRSWRDSLRLGYRIKGTFSADTGRIGFLVLDDSNFQRWLGRLTYEALVSRTNAEEDSFDTVVGGTAWYNIVVDNRSDKLDKGITLFVQKTTP